MPVELAAARLSNRSARFGGPCASRLAGSDVWGDSGWVDRLAEGINTPHINTTTICGHLGRDAEMKHLPSGHSITSFSIALNTGTKEKPRTCWLDVKAWNQPESALDALKKGAAITVTGRIDSESWEDKKTGEKKTKVVVVADLIHVPIWEKRERQEQGGLVSQPRSSRPAAQVPVDDEDVPF